MTITAEAHATIGRFRSPRDPRCPAVSGCEIRSTASWKRLAAIKGLKPAPRGVASLSCAGHTHGFDRAAADSRRRLPRISADGSPRAWEHLIDKLLASPHYGERWGRHWLDVARYADSNGFEHDFDRPNAWRYRDYVIRAFNQGHALQHFPRRADRR